VFTKRDLKLFWGNDYEKKRCREETSQKSSGGKFEKSRPSRKSGSTGEGTTRKESQNFRKKNNGSILKGIQWFEENGEGPMKPCRGEGESQRKAHHLPRKKNADC